MLLLSLMINTALKMVGILLFAVLLIVSAATVCLYSKSPKQMIYLLAVVALMAVLIGLVFSLNFDKGVGVKHPRFHRAKVKQQSALFHTQLVMHS